MFDIRRTRPVSDIGFGGSCHLAVQLAPKADCKVIFFFSRKVERKEVFRYGAREFAGTNISRYLSSSNRVFYPLTVSFEDIHLLHVWLFSGTNVQASIVIPRSGLCPMLGFEAFHGVEATNERYRSSKEDHERVMREYPMQDLMRGLDFYSIPFSW